MVLEPAPEVTIPIPALLAAAVAGLRYDGLGVRQVRRGLLTGLLCVRACRRYLRLLLRRLEEGLDGEVNTYNTYILFFLVILILHT